MARLFVIEAPGKVRELEAILERLGLPSRVQATRGHIYQLPESLDTIGIDRTFRDFERKPRDLTVIDWLRKEAAVADEVYVATDADAEGDVIAWDVAETIRDLHPNLMRIRLKGMDDESVREAIAIAAPLRKEDAVPGRTRAIVDRLIGAGFSRNGVAVGRVGTALLGLVQDKHPSVRKIRLCAPARDGGRPFTAEADIGTPIDLDLAKRLVKLDLPALDIKGSRELKTLPAHTGDIMVRAGDQLDMSPKEVSASMQGLYEAGRMSYPRSGSRGISPATAAKMAAVLRKAGYDVDGTKIAPKSDTGVHDAPYPIGPVDLAKSPERLGHVEGVRTLVARDMVKAGQRHTEEVPVVEGLLPFLAKQGFSKDVAVAVARLPWRREVGPAYPGRVSWPESEIIVRRADVVLLEHAVRANLGRPSTWGRHIDQFMNRGLADEDLRLTAKGREWIAASPKELLDARVSAAIEAACERPPESSFSDPDREPWEMNAERIITALPPQIRDVVARLVINEPPHQRIDPVVAYGQPTDVLAEAETLRSVAPAYTPAGAD